MAPHRRNGWNGNAIPTTAPPQFAVDTTAPYHLDDQGLPTQMAWPNNLQGAIDHRRRVTRPPQVDPANDFSISIVAANQEALIGRMVQAMFNTTAIHDNPTFRGLHLFTRGHASQVPGHDIEATCRLLLAAVLDRCTTGYRGAPSSNRLLNAGHRFEAVDRDGSCETRVASVIRALREWKSVCKDVLYSDAKVEALANAPASVWRDKMEQKGNNATKKRSLLGDRARARESGVEGYGEGEGDGASGERRKKARGGRKDDGRKTAGRRKQAAPSQTQDDAPPNLAAPLSYRGPNSDQTWHFGGNDAFQHGVQFAPQIPPAYAPAALYGGTNSYDIARQGQYSMSEKPIQTPPAPVIYTPAHAGFSQQPPGGFGSTRPELTGLWPASSGPIEPMNRFDAGTAPINGFNIFSSSSTHYQFSDVTWSPNSIFPPQGQFGGDFGVPAHGLPYSTPVMPKYHGSGVGGSATGAAGALQSPFSTKTAATHARAATMDALAQPIPKRIKREDDESESVQHVGKIDKKY